MTRLAQAPNPLLEAEPTANPVEPHSQLRLTDIGRRVLDGHEDHIALNGIDRWIGGVHLTRPRAAMALERRHRNDHHTQLLVDERCRAARSSTSAVRRFRPIRQSNPT